MSVVFRCAAAYGARVTHTPYSLAPMVAEAVPVRRAAVDLRSVTKIHGRDAGSVRALDDVSLTFDAGTFTAVMGPSGSGKSTLLQCAAGLDRPTSGTVHIDGEDLSRYGEADLTRLRRDRIGFVFQTFNLLPTLTVRQNVTLPLELAGERPRSSSVDALLVRLGMKDRADRLPGELSGGQQQRVAFARAVLAEPAVIFADEPTGALDTHAAREVLHLLRSAVTEHGRTIVMVTHDPNAASYADSVVFLADGRVVDTLAHPGAQAVATHMARLGKEVR